MLTTKNMLFNATSIWTLYKAIIYVYATCTDFSPTLENKPLFIYRMVIYDSLEHIWLDLEPYVFT